MRTIVVASHNPVKIEAVRNAFRKMFPDKNFQVESFSVKSGVGDQPLSDHDTLKGALNRAKAVAAKNPQADYCLGIEGGVEDTADGMSAFAWIVVISPDRIGRGRTGTFFIPEKVASLVREGKELGDANDIFFSRKNSKQGSGAIGLLTGNIVDRTQLYEHGILMALVPFKIPELYPPCK